MLPNCHPNLLSDALPKGASLTSVSEGPSPLTLQGATLFISFIAIVTLCRNCIYLYSYLLMVSPAGTQTPGEQECCLSYPPPYSQGTEWALNKYLSNGCLTELVISDGILCTQSLLKSTVASEVDQMQRSRVTRGTSALNWHTLLIGVSGNTLSQGWLGPPSRSCWCHLDFLSLCEWAELRFAPDGAHQEIVLFSSPLGLTLVRNPPACCPSHTVLPLSCVWVTTIELCG